MDSTSSKPSAWRVDFAEKLPYYTNMYALVIDNCLTEADCSYLLHEAESRSSSGWEAAAVNASGVQVVNVAIRSCGRIMIDDAELADFILQKVKPFLDEGILELDSDAKDLNDPTNNTPGIGKHVLLGTRGCSGKWRLTRLNERLRFLKYGVGQYFKPHWDGQYLTPDYKERSFLTLHLYLNDSSHLDPSVSSSSSQAGSVSTTLPLIGGATRFWSKSMENYIDVEPRVGRVLVFQHRGLFHSGEEIQQGIKLTMRTDLMYERIPTEKTGSSATSKEKRATVPLRHLFNRMNL